MGPERSARPSRQLLLQRQLLLPMQFPSTKFDKALNTDENWYFSWGYSRQQYAPSDIRVSQPELGNDFTVRKAQRQ